MAIATNTLMDEGKCYMCFGPLTSYQILKLALLRRIALIRNPSADVSPQALFTATNCYTCLGLTLFDSMNMALLNIINGT